MSLKLRSTGDFNKTLKFLARVEDSEIVRRLDIYGRKGVNALRIATPIDSGETANSWSYEIVQEGGKYTIFWTNSHIVDGACIAVLLQYGHATRQGGYVQGRDYINPALRPIFDEIAADAWREVSS